MMVSMLIHAQFGCETIIEDYILSSSLKKNTLIKIINPDTSIVVETKIKIESGIDELINVFNNTKENFINNY